ncbi:MAG: MFS transporter [Deltaproteobacteria bacterium]|nr:MFS transporter [Deltaproteobacteria bacterium]
MSQPKLSLWQLFNMAVGFLGIQFAWSIQMGQMSGIYERLGATTEQISWFWIAGPITGMLVQPIVGNMSDHTWNRLGRRRPFFLVGAILASCALIVMPNSPSLWVAASLLWILDASINISMEPFRALVADLAPKEQRGTAYSFQSFAIGVGSVLSFGIGGIVLFKWIVETYGDKGTALLDFIHPVCPSSLHALFYIGALVLICCILWTIFTTKEYPPEDLAAFRVKSKKDNPVLKSFIETWRIILAMPQNMKRLCVVHALSWFALFCMFIFFSPMVASNVFKADPNTPFYDEGIAWASLCYLALNVVCFLASPIIGYLTQHFRKKTVHAVNLIIGAAGYLTLFYAESPVMAMAGMAVIGVSWASILSLPYAILSGTVPRERYGIFMGAFNIFICLPQIICSLVAGPLVSFLGGDKSNAMIMACIAFALAALFLKWVKEPKPGEQDAAHSQ